MRVASATRRTPTPAEARNPNAACLRLQVLEGEQAYLDALPCAEMYEKSFMHRDVITHVVRNSPQQRRCTESAHAPPPQLHTRTDFYVTGSADGHLKFWKRKAEGVEFVKHYRSHPGAVVSMAGAFALALPCAAPLQR